MARGADGRFVAGIDMTLVDRVSSPMRKILSLFPALDKVGKNAGKAFNFGANLKLSADGMKDFSTKVGGLVQEPIKKFMAFEKQMSSVKSALFSGEDTVATRAAMDEVAATARRLGATTQFSATEAAGGIDILAKNFKDGPGKATEVMRAMPGILDLAAASTESIATASDIASASMNQFGLSAGDMGRIGDVLVKTANSSATGLTDIGEALKNSGVAAAGAGISLEKTTALIGALGNAGVKGGEAGTALRAMILRLQAPNAKAKSALDFLGVNTKDKAGNLRPIEQLLAEIDQKANQKFGKDKNGNRRANLMKGLFEDEAFAAANVLTAQAGSGELAKVIEANYGAAGTAAKTAKEMSNNAAGASANLSSAWEELQLTVGEKLIPHVTELLKGVNDLVSRMTAWAGENPGLVKGLAMVGGTLAVVGIVMGPIISGLGALASAYGVLSGGLGLATKGVKLFSGGFVSGFKAIGLAIKANPVGLILTGIALAATLIYENWEPISAFFTNMWDGITSGFKSAMDWILEQIKWVGDKVEEFMVGVMTPDQATIYVAQKEAEAATIKSNSSLFADDLDTSLTGKGNVDNRFATKVDPVAELKRAFTGTKSSEQGPPLLPQGAPLLPEGGLTGIEQMFTGNLQITVNGENQVVGTQMKQAGNAPLAVRVSTGRQ